METAPLQAGPGEDRVVDVDAWQRRVATAFARAEVDPGEAWFSGHMRTFARDGSACPD